MSLQRLTSACAAFLVAVTLASCGGTTPSTPDATRVATTASPATPLASAAPSPTGTALLIEALRKGGLYLVMRHGAIDTASNEAALIDLDDCKTQASMSENGKRDLRKMAADIAGLGFAIGTVWASPYCRTMETGRLVFGKATPNDLLLRSAYTPTPGKPAAAPAQQRLGELRKLLGTIAPTNVVLVTHGDTIRGALAIDVAEGETVLVQPDGASFTVIGRIPVLGWSSH